MIKNFFIKDNSNILLDPKETFLKGNIEKNSYVGYKNYHPKMPSTNGSKSDELLLDVVIYDFYLQELNLYLDTHPLDKNALSVFKESRVKYLEILKEYEKNYGPIDLYSFYTNNDYWEWLDV